MLRWIDIIRFATQGNPVPEHVVTKTDEEWRAQLTPEQYRITRQAGTERAFSSEQCGRLEPGTYACLCCGAELFDADEKFDSGTGWPSFTQPIRENAVAYRRDESHDMSRIEALCNTCRAHLGHVFLDGPPPGGLRYCINALALSKTASSLRKATLGGGCFWCTEALFQSLRGVHKVQSGYSGGHVVNPTCREVCSGRTGHAEVIQVTYDPAHITYPDLLRVHLGTHNPTLRNQQGADKGTQYRSIIFYRNTDEEAAAQQVLAEVNELLEGRVVTQLVAFEAFYPAEPEHQNYYQRYRGKPYCEGAIEPKLAKLRQSFRALLKPLPLS